MDAPASGDAGFEFIDADVQAGTIELAFAATEAFTNPSGNVLGAFQAAMPYDTVEPALLPASPATAHVHGITPLRCVGTANDGANQTDATPASAASGGPISGLIPRDVGNAPLTVGDGGFDTPACPVSP